MISYLLRHEAWAKKVIESGDIDWNDALLFHRAEISVIQSERIAHLIVTMFVGLFLMVSFSLAIIMPRWETVSVSAILLFLFAAYIRHYFLLENGLQRLYELGLKMEKKRNPELTK